jgi:hypothetical protein
MKLRSLPLVFAAFLSNAALADALQVDDLPPETCSGEYNDLVYRTSKDPSEERCVLHFIQPETYDGDAAEKEAEVSVSGSIIKLSRVGYSMTSGHRSSRKPTLGDKYTYAFVSGDKSIKAVLTTRVVDSSCEVDTDSCCGDNYQGTLVIQRNGKKTVVPVSYYRGG